MCKRNSPEKKKKETNTGYVRETSQLKRKKEKRKKRKKKKSARDIQLPA